MRLIVFNHNLINIMFCAIKCNSGVGQANGGPSTRPEHISQATHDKLARFYQPWNEKLGHLLGLGRSPWDYDNVV